MDWIGQNAGTIIISLILLVAVVAAVRKLWKDKKQKGGSCGCGCGSCSSCGMCHTQKKQTGSCRLRVCSFFVREQFVFLKRPIFVYENSKCTFFGKF